MSKKITYNINTTITTENGVDLKTLGSILQQFTQEYLYIVNDRLYGVADLKDIKNGYKLSSYDGCFCHTDGISNTYCFSKDLSDHWNNLYKILSNSENIERYIKPTVKFNLSRRFIELSHKIPNIEHNEQTNKIRSNSQEDKIRSNSQEDKILSNSQEDIMSNSRINGTNSIVNAILYKRKTQEIQSKLNSREDTNLVMSEINNIEGLEYVSPDVSPNVTPYLTRKSGEDEISESEETEEDFDKDFSTKNYVNNEEVDDEEFDSSEDNNSKDIEVEIPKPRKYNDTVSLYDLPTTLRDVIIDTIYSVPIYSGCYIQPFYYNGATIKITFNDMVYKDIHYSEVYQVYDIFNWLNLDRLNPNLWGNYKTFDSKEKGYSNMPIALFTINEYTYETNINDVTPVFNDLNREKDIIENDLKDMFLNKPKMYLMKIEIIDNNVKLYVICDIDNSDTMDKFWNIESSNLGEMLLYLVY